MRRTPWILSLLFAALTLSEPAEAQRSRRAASPLVRVLQTAPDARSRAQAALTLGELGAMEAMPAVCWAAVRAFWAIKEVSTTPNNSCSANPSCASGQIARWRLKSAQNTQNSAA